MSASNAFISIDGGTTNTRIYLVVDGNVVDCEKYSVGAGTNSDGILEKSIKEGIEQIVCRNGLTYSSIRCILMSGMICSELGIIEIPHIKTPVSKDKLALALKKTEKSIIGDIEAFGIAGVKNDTLSFENADLMRGEETEFFGVKSDFLLKNEKTLVILPGSHTKLVFSANGEIIKCLSTLSGEMIAALSQNTILKNTFISGLSNEIDDEYLKMGFDLSLKYGINNALFRVRIMDKSFNCDKAQLSSFFTGAVLQGDIEQILKYQDEYALVVAGANTLTSIFITLLNYAKKEKTLLLCDKNPDLQPFGAYEILKKAIF